MLGDVCRIDLCDVSRDLFVSGKIRRVSLLTVLVPFAGEHAPSACCLESFAHSANTGKQVNKRERRRVHVVSRRVFADHHPQLLDGRLPGLRFSALPAINSPLRVPKEVSKLRNRQPGTDAQVVKGVGEQFPLGHFVTYCHTGSQSQDSW